MCKLFINLLPLLLSFLILIWCYYTFVILYCVLYLTSLVEKTIYLGVYHFLLIMFEWAFLQTMLCRHKQVPEEYRLEPSEHERLMKHTEEEIDAILKKLIDLRKLEVLVCSSNGRVRYCKACHLVKPDRAHHCSSCGRCILKMDHHCPWVYNCVGFSNHKYFVLTLLYCVLWAAFYVGTVFQYVTDFRNDYHINFNKLQIGIGFGVAILSGVLLLVLFLYHVSLLCRNETTLESLRDVTFNRENLSFDLGKWQNFTAVFGENVCCWLVPVFSSQGNGTEFRVKSIID